VHSRLMMTLLATNAVLLVVVIGWLTWITVEPRYWFPGAYAEQGPSGDKGPRGDSGPSGPSGPVGPEALTAYEELSSELGDLEGQLSSLSGQIDTVTADLESLASMTGGSILERTVEEARDAAEEVQNTAEEAGVAAEDAQLAIDNLCSQFASYSGTFEEIYLLGC